MNKQNRQQYHFNQAQKCSQYVPQPISPAKTNHLQNQNKLILSNINNESVYLIPQKNFSSTGQGNFYYQKNTPQFYTKINVQLKPNSSCLGFGFNPKSSIMRQGSKDRKHSKISDNLNLGRQKASKFSLNNQKKDNRRMTEDNRVPSFIKKRQMELFEQQKIQRKQRNSGRKGSIIKSAIMDTQDFVTDECSSKGSNEYSNYIPGVQICFQQSQIPICKSNSQDITTVRNDQRQMETKLSLENNFELSQKQQQQGLVDQIKQLSHQMKQTSVEKDLQISTSKLQLKLQQSLKRLNQHYMSKFPKLQDFELGQMLGKGANGSVHVARHKPTGFFLAIKNYSIKFVKENLTRFTENIRLQMACKHPNIASLYGFFIQNDQFYLLMQLCIDIDLNGQAKYIRKNARDVKEVIRGIARGIMYLHTNKIIHRDIKLQNVLMSHEMPKLTDFDLSVYQNNPVEQRTTFCGSPAYFSPEMLSNASYNNKADMWSFGVLCYQLICGYYPFQTANYNDTMDNIRFQSPKPYPENLSKETKQFISIMLIKNPDDRASIKEVMAHQYLSKDEKNMKRQFNV